MSLWNIVAALAAAVVLEGAQGAIAQENGVVVTAYSSFGPQSASQ